MKIKLAKTIITMLATINLVYAADNSIYIDQAGDNATIAVTQDGAGNTVRGLPGTGTGNQTPAKIYGDGNQVTVNQVGGGNMLKLGIQTDTSVGATTVNYSITSSLNSTATIQVGEAANNSTANNIGVTQTGNSNTTNIKSIGASNTVTVNTVGGNNATTVTALGDSITSTLAVTGTGNNTVSMDLQSTGGSSVATVAGSANSLTVAQSGGAFGHQSTVDLTGSGNTVSVTQQGTAGDNISNLKIAGSGSTITVNQNNR
jgi:hypothetical protein